MHRTKIIFVTIKSILITQFYIKYNDIYSYESGHFGMIVGWASQHGIDPLINSVNTNMQKIKSCLYHVCKLYKIFSSLLLSISKTLGNFDPIFGAIPEVLKTLG